MIDGDSVGGSLVEYFDGDAEGARVVVGSRVGEVVTGDIVGDAVGAGIIIRARVTDDGDGDGDGDNEIWTLLSAP